MDQIDLQPFHWEYRDVDGHVQILCWALTEGKDCKEESEAHLVRIENFRTSFWIELPRFVNGRVLKWDESMAGHYYNYISNCMQKKRCSPIGYTFDHRMDIYNYQTRTKPYLLMIFPTTKAMQETEKFLSKKREFYIGKNRIGWIEAKVWESDIPTIRKMLTFRDCKFSGWLRFKGYHPKARGTLYDSDDGGKGVDIEYDKMGRAVYRERDEEQFEQISKLPLEHEWIVDWSDIQMTPNTEPISKSITYPKVLAYDIEVYSDNVRKFPDMLTREHCVFMISCVFQRAGKPETRRYHALVCGDVNEIPVERWTTLKGAVVEKCTDELDLISGMARLVNEYDVDVLTGYNVYDFDNPYMDARLKLSLRKEWPHMGRLLDDKTEMFSSTWESGGYGFNSINDLKISGRITIDMLPVVRRGLQKLLKYNLETVAKHFLDRGKHDVTPAEMFLSFERNREAIQAWNDMLEKANPVSYNMINVEEVLANLEARQNDQESHPNDDDDDDEEVTEDGEYQSNEEDQGDEEREIDEDYDYDQDEDTDDQKQSQADSAAMMEYKRICNEIMAAVNEELLEAEKTLTSEEAGKKWLQERDVKNEEIRKAIYANSFKENEAKMHDRKKAWRAEFEEKYTKEELMDIRAKYSQAEVKAELVMHDNLNDPARSPMYTRDGKLNWCSIETWDYFVALGKDCVRARGLKPPEGADVDVLVTFSAAKYLMTRILVYCLFDSDLCIELFEKLTVWIGLIQMSSVVGVTPLDLFTRGQQIRCLSQLYDRGSKMGYILNKRPSPDIYFNGGFVFNVVPGIYDGVMVEDFASLYPSIMIAYNICYSTLLLKKDFGTLPEDDVFTITVPRPDAVAEDGAEYDLTQEHDMDVEKSDEEIAEDEEESVAKDRKNQIMASLADVVSDNQNFYFQFVKPHIKEGILPGILRTLIAERKAVRTEQYNYEKGTLMWKILEEKQLAIKVSSNSMFGFLGAGKMGKRSLIEGAMSITAMGRKLITHVNKKVEEEYGCKMVYGDTDSSMFSKPGIPANEFNSYGKYLEKEISKDFLDPLRLEFEKAMKMIALARKKYAGYVYKDDGTYVIDKDTGLPYLYLRGNVLARRDNAKWLRIVFEKLIRMALDEVPVEEMLLYLIDVVDKFMTDPIDHNALVTVRSVSAHYKNQTYFMKLFADRLAREGMPIRPGERIGYLVVKGRNDTENKYIGNRMVLPEMYLASRHEKNPYEIDRLYYLEKQFMNSIDQVIHAGFGKRMGGLMKIQYRKKGCRKYHGLDTPVQLMVKLYQNGVPIDKLRESIRAVYNNDKRGPVLSVEYELNRYEYPKTTPLTFTGGKTSKTAATPTSVVSVKEALQKARQNKLAEKKAVTSKSPPIKSTKGVNIADQFC